VELCHIRFEKVRRFLRVTPRNVVKSGRGYIVSFALPDQGVILQKILKLGFVTLGLSAQNSLGFRSI
jgi:hypothetical protein